MGQSRRNEPPPGVQGDLFDGRDGQWEDASSQAPLAARMRPRDLDEFIGQDAVVAAGKPLRLMVERDEVPSIVLWGPPGTGKT
ncbi:MAG: replication-associated recombination protein A, partial [Dehalococcoidia bacterium]|nr:replication-associated recombination protein A [Dehalococcoidia bacterium]